jgi:hypothetical protein
MARSADLVLSSTLARSFVLVFPDDVARSLATEAIRRASQGPWGEKQLSDRESSFQPLLSYAAEPWRARH